MKRARHVATVATITQPTLPTGLRSLVWGAWPSPNARLRIAETPGVWAFRHGVEYGPHDKRVALVRWHEREQPMAEWRVAPLYAVRVEEV